jgi:hypothetical protein
MKRESVMKALCEGTYKAICRESNFLAAVMNGHSDTIGWMICGGFEHIPQICVEQYRRVCTSPISE